MLSTSVIALFCEDIREEKSGMFTLVGVLSDNINIPAPPVANNETSAQPMLAKLSIYVRINFDVSTELGPITTKITMPDGSELPIRKIDEGTVAKARETSKKGNPMGGIISRIQFVPFPIKKYGRLSVEVTIGTETYLAGFLNFVSEGQGANS